MEMTKKLFLQWMMVAILICGLSVLASCSSDNDDNNGGSEYKGVPLQTARHCGES